MSFRVGKISSIMLSAVLLGTSALNPIVLYAAEDSVIVEEGEEYIDTVLDGSADLSVSEDIVKNDDLVSSSENEESGETVSDTDNENDVDTLKTGDDEQIIENEEQSFEVLDNSLGENAKAANPESDFEWEGTTIKAYIGATGSNVEVIIPKKAQEIGGSAFKGKKIGKLRFEEGSACNTIRQYAFSGCGLTEVSLTDNIHTIERYAFFDNNLAEITIPEFVQIIGGSSFKKNSTLKTVVINAKALSKADGTPFSGDPLTNISFGSSVTYVCDSLFQGSDLSNCDVVIPAQITEIQYAAFNNSKAKSVTIEGNALKIIGDDAFSGCSFKTIGFPDSLEKIGDRAFEYCQLTSVTFPAGINSIGSWSFNNNLSLKEINYNVTSLLKIGYSSYQVFAGAPLERVNIGSNVRIIPAGFLYKCDLSRIANIEIPAAVTEIGRQAFYKSGLQSVTFRGDKVKTIGVSAFENCPINSIDLPHSVTDIGQYAFNYTQSLSQIVLPKNLKQLEAGTFTDDIALQKIAIYKDTKIQKNPFDGISTSLLVIYCYPGSPAEKFAKENGFGYKSIDEWEGGNPYGKSSGGSSEGPEILPDAGETGFDDAIKLVETEKNTYSAETVKGRSFSLGKGKWTSNDPSVVSIKKANGAAKAKNTGTATLTDSNSGTVVSVKVYAPLPDIKKCTLFAGGDALDVSLSGLDGSALETTWISTNYEVASVEGTGNAVKIVPLGKGSAKVRCFICGKAYDINVVVKDVYTATKLKNDDSLTLNVFQSAKLSYESGFNVKKAVWTDDKDEALTADSAVYVKNGKIFANKTIDDFTIKGSNGSDSVTLKVTVKPLPTKSVIYLNKGSSKTYSNSFAKGNDIQWTASETNISLSNTSKAKVKITGNSVGTSTLTCICKGEKIVTEVIVEDPVPASGTVTLTAGEQGSLDLNNLQHPVIFSSSKKKVAFADETGKIYARTKGTAKISAKINGKKVKVTVKVEQ